MPEETLWLDGGADGLDLLDIGYEDNVSSSDVMGFWLQDYAVEIQKRGGRR